MIPYIKVCFVEKPVLNNAENLENFLISPRKFLFLSVTFITCFVCHQLLLATTTTKHISMSTMLGSEACFAFITVRLSTRSMLLLLNTLNFLITFKHHADTNGHLEVSLRHSRDQIIYFT